MLFRLTALIVFAATPMCAEELRIVTDIAPVQSLVQQVAGDDAEVLALLPPGASPHGYALRPSEARALQEADLVVWVGPSLTPWLEEAIDSLAPDAQLVTLGEVEGVLSLPYREVALFGEHGGADHDGHDHGGHKDHAGHAQDEHDGHDHAKHDDHAEHDDHGHDKHHDHADHEGHDHDAHDEHADHDGHDHAKHEEHAGHNHDHDHSGGVDPHMWLDPRNAVVWLDHMSEIMQAILPERANDIRQRTDVAKGDLASLEATITARLSPLSDVPFLVYHDAYQYFGTRFGLTTAGAVAASDAQAPGPARLVELKAALGEQQIGCVFYEPQYSPRLLAALEVDGTIRQEKLDPLGSELTAGPELYGALLGDLADTMVTCLSPQS